MTGIPFIKTIFAVVNVPIFCVMYMYVHLTYINIEKSIHLSINLSIQYKRENQLDLWREKRIGQEYAV